MKMKQCLALVLASSLALAANVSADEEKNISVLINKENDKNAILDLKIDGTASKFELPELKEGESRTLSNNGTTITVTKTDGNVVVTTADGEEIVLPGGDHKAMVARVKALHTLDGAKTDDSIKIIATDLTDDQKETIKASIAAAGITKVVKFIDDANFFVVRKEFDTHGSAEDVQELEWISEDGKQKKIKRVMIKKEVNDN